METLRPTEEIGYGPLTQEQAHARNEELDVAMFGLADEVEKRLGKEESLESRINAHEEKITRVNRRQTVADQTHERVNRTIVSRSTTDPNSNRAQITQQGEPLLPESTVFQRRHKKVIDKLIDGDLDHTLEISEVPSRGLLTKISEVMSERRRRKLENKQWLAKQAETITSWGNGRGKKSALKTRITQTKMVKSGVSNYRSGNTTAKEFVDNMRAARFHVEHSPVRAIKRQTRKERNVAAKADFLSKQPIRSKVRAIRSKQLRKKVDKLHQKRNESRVQTQALQQQLIELQSQRYNFPEDED